MGYTEILKILQSRGINAALLHDNKFLLSALDVSSDGILISDKEGNILYINKAYEKTTGITQEDMVGMNLRDLQRNRYFNFSANICAIENKHSVNIIHKYYTGKHAFTSAMPIYMGSEKKIRGAISNTRNIGELFKLRRKVKESNALYLKYADAPGLLQETHIKSEGVIAASPVMQEVLKLARTAAEYDTTVAIYGETGTGKEVIAKYIHSMSKRRGNPFIKVNCAAIPGELFESELFGYEAGAFTGALHKGKTGMFELANKGTILLDEVSELPLSMQSKLLRVLQEKEIVRVGGSSPVKLDVRVISATNKNLKQEVEQGNFREDLYFRLNVLPVTLPALRERREDTEQFIMYFLANLNCKYKKTVAIDDNAKHILMNYDFPGNVRELQNLIEYLFITASDDEITAIQFPARIIAASTLSSEGKDRNISELATLVEIFEKNIISDELKKHSSIRKASKMLGLHPSTLCRKIKKYNIDIENVDMVL